MVNVLFLRRITIEELLVIYYIFVVLFCKNALCYMLTINYIIYSMCIDFLEKPELK